MKAKVQEKKEGKMKIKIVPSQPLFNNFFGCMGLETGGKVIAILGIIAGGIGVLGKKFNFFFIFFY